MSRDPVVPVRVRCPSERCGRVLSVLPEWLGRNMYCPACGVRMTARPIGAVARLREREREVVGGTGVDANRLPLSALVDNVRSLWNVGSIFRTADACGFEKVLLAGISGCPPRPEIAKTALGAEEAVAWTYHAEPARALAAAKADGYVPVALETTGTARSIHQIGWPDRVCLVIGNEVAGISQDVLAACPLHVRIPMRGIKSSLNVAVAFGIAAAGASAALADRRDSRDPG